jgi:triphosphatase
MEIEAKFLLTEPVTPSQVAALSWAPYQLDQQMSLVLHDVFWDTPDRKLSSSCHAVRLRQANDLLLVTMKGPGVVEQGVHSREEWEGPATGENPDGWPEEIRTRLQQFVDVSSLTPLLEIHNRRHIWLVLHNDHVISELALDEGTIHAGGKQMQLHELEIELKGGSRDDLDALRAIVEQYLPAKLEERSKFARGLALLENNE